MHWFPDPKDVQKFRASGLVNMGDVTDAHPSPSFGLDVPFVLLFVRAWATGGTGAGATMSLKQKLVNDPSRFFANTIREFDHFSTDDVPFQDFRVQSSELYHWSFAAGTLLVPEWTNPDPESPPNDPDPMRWAIEVGLAPTPVD